MCAAQLQGHGSPLHVVRLHRHELLGDLRQLPIVRLQPVHGCCLRCRQGYSIHPVVSLALEDGHRCSTGVQRHKKIGELLSGEAVDRTGEDVDRATLRKAPAHGEPEVPPAPEHFRARAVHEVHEHRADLDRWQLARITD